MPKRLTIQDAQLQIDVKFPDSNIKIIEFSNTNGPCTIQHPDLGVANFSRYNSILHSYKDTQSLLFAIQRKTLGRASLKPLHEVQAEFDERFPNSNITIIDYQGSSRDGILHHPEYGNLRFPYFHHLMRAPSTEKILKTLSNNKLNRQKSDIIKQSEKFEIIERLYHTDGMTPQEFYAEVGEILDN